jgi:hypothetical protein
VSKRQEILEQDIKFAKESFKDHEIVKSGEDRWIIAHKKDGYISGVYKTEIILLYNDSIYVGGDIDVVVFSYGPSDGKERLKWIGLNNSYKYVEEKAKIGSNHKYECIDDTVLEEDLEKLAEEYPDHYTKIIRLIDAIPNIDYIREELYDIFSEDVHVGEIIDSRIIYAKEALNKLCELLEGDNCE